MRRSLFTIAVVFGAALRLSQWFDRFEIAEDSMLPALANGDFVVTSRRVSDIRPGAVVVFRHPDREDFWLAKRVVATGGDWVEIGHGEVRRNSLHLVGPATSGHGVWRLEADELFVLGDNRARSADDSRTLGPVGIGQVDGVVVARYWPFRSARLFRQTMPPSAVAAAQR